MQDDLMYKWGKMYDTPYESAFDFHKGKFLRIHNPRDYTSTYGFLQTSL